MEHTIDQNKKNISRISEKIKIMDNRTDDTYNHPDITSKDTDTKMKVRDTQ